MIRVPTVVRLPKAPAVSLRGFGSVDIYDPVTGEFLYTDPTINTGEGLNLLPTPPIINAGGGLTADQLARIISGGATTALQIYKATQSPSLIPGTGTIYDPATGRILSQTGFQLGGQGFSGQLGFGNVGTFVAIGGALVLVVLVISMARR